MDKAMITLFIYRNYDGRWAAAESQDAAVAILGASAGLVPDGEELTAYYVGDEPPVGRPFYSDLSEDYRESYEEQTCETLGWAVCAKAKDWAKFLPSGVVMGAEPPNGQRAHPAFGMPNAARKGA